MHKKCVMITGGKGFIGSRLKTALARKYRVKSLDREHDIRNPKNLNFKGVDLVIHLAAEVGRIRGEEIPNQMLETNVLGTLNVVKECLKHNCKLINFSTSEVYGLNLLSGDNFQEDEIMRVSPFNMTNIYGMSKLFAETLVRHYSNLYGLKAISVRPFMVYGPGQVPSKYKAAIDQFVVAALTGGILNVHKGSNRAWCHVSDFVRAIELIVADHKFKSYEAYNIGVDEYVDMEEVAKRIVKKIGSGIIKTVKPPPILVVKKRVSFNKIKKLGFKQSVSLDEGIDELIKWHAS